MKRVNHQQRGYVLHTRPYRESSLLIDVFCEGHGRFMVNAKGARRQKSGMRGVLMPFKPLLLSWSGRGQLPVLTGAESLGFLEELRGDHLHSAWYLNELLLKLLHRHDEHDALFAAYDAAIRGLAARVEVNRILRLFEKRLLGETGFGLVLDHDADTGEVIDATKTYQYFPDHGPVAENETGNGSQSTGATISGRALISLRQDAEPDEVVRNEVRNLQRRLISSQLGDRDLRSRRVYIQLQNHLRRVPGQLDAPTGTDS